jgi:hypothetical protein
VPDAAPSAPIIAPAVNTDISVFFMRGSPFSSAIPARLLSEPRSLPGIFLNSVPGKSRAPCIGGAAQLPCKCLPTQRYNNANPPLLWHGTEPLSPQVQAWHDCRIARTDETKIPDDAARDEIVQRRPELKGKSLEAMRRILRREKRLSLWPTRSSKSDSLDEEQRKRLVVSERD